MVETIKSVFERECGDLKIDLRLIKRIENYARGWVNSNQDHVEFMGSNLLGVHPIRFKQSDRNLWFDDVIEVDDFSLKDSIHSLPSINPKFQIQSDVMNLSCLWLVHAIHKEKNIPEQKKHEAKINVLLVLHYKFLSSLMAYNFKYPADKSVALATYAALSKKYALKQHGSWAALLHARCEDIISKKSIHYNTIERFDDDEAIIYLVNDIQGRIREVVKKMLVVFYKVREQDAKISTTSAGTIDLDGNATVRDKTRNQNSYRRYIQEIITDKRNFIKTELVNVVVNAMHTMPPKLFVESLEYMSDNYQVRGEKDTDELINEVLLHAFEYIGSTNDLSRNLNLAKLITKLRALYMASRSSDPSVLKMRELAEKIVKNAVKSKNATVIASIRTGILLYIVVRAFAMRHYSK